MRGGLLGYGSVKGRGQSIVVVVMMEEHVSVCYPNFSY